MIHSNRNQPTVLICVLLVAAGRLAPSLAQPATHPLVIDSGVQAGVGHAPTLVFADVIQAPGNLWTRVHFADYELGADGYVVLRSAADGAEQRLDARSLPEWSNSSAVFNGDTVEIEVYAAAADGEVFVAVDRVWEPRLTGGQELPDDPGTRSICGDSDNRVASNDARVGRLWFCGADRNCNNNVPGGCTGWLVYNGVALSAGHCDILVGDILEFNVGPTSANGIPSAGSPNDQYPITQVADEENGPGADWAVFTLGRNSNTNLRAHIAQGWFRMTDIAPNDGDTIRVTGYGLDNRPAGAGGTGTPCCDADGDGDCDNNCNSSSLTLQTATGPYDDFSGGGTIHEYVVDTMPANSGSPVIWEDADGLSIGIHTTGGCDDFLAGNDNEGTAFAYSVLEDVLNDVWLDVVYVDSALLGPPETGRVFEPLGNVAEAVAAVPAGGIVYIVPAGYSAVTGNVFTAGADGKAMTLLAFVGPVTIGN